MPARYFFSCALAAIAYAPGLLAQQPSPVDAGRRVEAKNGVVTSANSLASEAGVQMLQAGGNAVDAIVAAAFAVGVVEPQMSGLGGSGSATIWMKRDGKPAYIDFYAAQPVDAWRGHTQPANVGRGGAAEGRGGRGGRGGAPAEEGAPATAAGDMTVVGVPGGVGGLLALHEKYGALSREQVLAPAIRIAEEGFPVGQILAGFIAGAENRMRPYPKALALYFPGGKALLPGDVLKNPELAASLTRIAKEGRKGFYEGPTAAGIVSVLNAGGNPTRASDFAKYEPQWKRPLCTAYRGYTIVTAAPPQTGYQVLHALELLEPFNLKTLGLPTQSAKAFDVMVSALRAGQSQTRYNSDPNWVAVPANGLSSEAFAATRKAVIGAGVAADSIHPADPTRFDNTPPAGECGKYDPYGAAAPIPGATGAVPPGFDDVGERSSDTDGETTHLSAVDKDGNAVALTITNSSVWGSGGFAEGFFLNNSGFRFTNENIGAPSRMPWRIRNTTIAPTIVMRRGQVELVIGAPGGARIPTEVLQVMVYVLDYGLDPLDAVKLPRIFTSAQNRQVQLEHGFAPELLREVRAMGYIPVAEAAGYARLYLIARRGGVWVGVADPRHDGRPRGY
jgi:gamma-glutamyltranspeptidase / glutathione hydrolase